MTRAEAVIESLKRVSTRERRCSEVIEEAEFSMKPLVEEISRNPEARAIVEAFYSAGVLETNNFAVALGLIALGWAACEKWAAAQNPS